MRPAFSVLFLTTLIGAGQGLMMVMFGVEAAATLGGGPTDLRSFFVAGSVLSVVLTGLGLIASFFHLGHPERAWRAMAGWRTSWLSREVIVLPAFMAAVFAYGVAHWIDSGPTVVLGVLAVVLALLLFVCTGMIYAAVKVIREWASPLTVVNYTLLGSASGATLGAALAAVAAPAYARAIAVAALALTLAGAVTRIAALIRNARLVPKSTLQTAIGVRHPRIVQKAQGAMGGSFNTREFFHGASEERVAQVRWTFLLLAFVAPLLLLNVGSAGALAAAFVLQMVGLLAERWYFFAQANHPQNLYYRSIA
jgi:DMSO reductase anchor subunit